MGPSVLITGVADRLGAELALKLSDDPELGDLYGLDVRDPVHPLGRAEFVHADTRHSVIAKLVRELQVQVVVHCALVTHQLEVRSMHETNVIGTMNMLAACSGEGSPVEQLVVKSSTAIYGADPTGPSFLTESMVDTSRRPRGPLQADLLELEQLTLDFSLRNPRVAVTVLRLADIVDRRTNTPLSRYLRLPVVPTVLGFDPRVQFLHGEDAVEALQRATLARHRGVFNVAAPGVLALSQAVQLAGGRPLPILPRLFGPAERLAVTAATGVPLTPRLLALIAYGQAIDCSQLLREFGWEPARDNRTVMSELGDRGTPDVLEAEVAPVDERALEAYLRRRRLSGRAGARQ